MDSEYIAPVNCALDRNNESCLDPVTWSWDYNKDNWDGKGMEIDFGKRETLVLTQVLKYRKEAAGMSGISIQLPTTFRKGETYKFTYTIHIL